MASITCGNDTFEGLDRAQHLRNRAADLRRKAANPAFRFNAATFREIAISYEVLAEQALFIQRLHTVTA